MKRHMVLWAGIVGSVLLAAPAHAAFVAPDFRGDANSTYQEWSFFTASSGAAPDGGLSNGNGSPTLTSALGTAMPSGNIYAFGAIDSIDIFIPQAGLAGFDTKVVLQTRTQGSEIDYGSINIGGLAPILAEETLREALSGGFGGDLVEYKFEWLLTGNDSFTVEFDGLEHMSFDASALDTIPVEAVPEAGSLALLALPVVGGIAIRTSRRRRQKLENEG